MTYDAATKMVRCDVCGRESGPHESEEAAKEVLLDTFAESPWMEEDGKFFCLTPCFPGDES